MCVLRQNNLFSQMCLYIALFRLGFTSVTLRDRTTRGVGSLSCRGVFSLSVYPISSLHRFMCNH